MTSNANTHTMEAMLKNWQERLIAVERRLARQSAAFVLPDRLETGAALVTDWNVPREAGFYYSVTGASANAPFNGDWVGTIHPLSSGPNAGRVVQELRSPQGSTANGTGIMQIWRRTWTGAAWGDWYSGEDAASLGSIDLNSIVWGGKYIQGTSANATLARNYPIDTRSGHLDVSFNSFGTSGDLAMQTYTETGPVIVGALPRQWRRNLISTGWTPWILSQGQVNGRISRATAQSVASGSAYIQQTGFSTDEATGMTASSTSLTIGEPGWYFIEGRIVWAANATGNRTITIYKNGASILGGVLQGNTATNSTPISEMGTCRLAVGDVLTLWGWQASGAALNATLAYMAASRIGP